MIEIYDDLLSVEETDHIESFLRDPKFPWFLSMSDNHYTTDIASIEQDSNAFSKESLLLGHTFYLDGVKNSENYSLSDFIMNRFLNQTNLEFKQLFLTAEYYAREGFPVHEIEAYHWKQNEEKLLKNKITKDVFLINNKAPKYATKFKNVLHVFTP